MPEDQSHEDLDFRLLTQMRIDFLEESQEHLDRLNLLLTQLEENPDNPEIINEVFRMAHTLKGTASFVGLDKVRDVAHRMEDVFGAIRKGTLLVTAALIDIMFEAMGKLTLLRDKARAQDTDDIDVSSLLDKLADFTKIGAQKRAAPLSEGSDKPGKITPARPTEEAQSAPLISETIRVPTIRLDNFLNLVGEMITTVNRLNDYSNRFRDNDLATIASNVTRLTRQIHSGLMSVRMVPVGRLFNKFPGVVRNLARELQKEVEFIIRGQDTELDNAIIEQMYDPLVHLLRNAVYHGLESPEDRRELGKPPVGRITLAARRHQNSITIEVSDDGQGIDPDRMRQVAVKRELLTTDAALNMTDEQAINLIFMPGFSSVEQVTDVSGRGVGLDVVKEGLRKLRGMVKIFTTAGQGVTFRIELPLTLAIIEVLLVRAGAFIYALPINSVTETLLIDPSAIETMEKIEVIFIHSQALPMMKLSSILRGLPDTSHNALVPVVVLDLAGEKVALAVDELLGKQDVVMKPLGEYLGQVEGVEGAAILADGSITLIIDVEYILRKFED